MDVTLLILSMAQLDQLTWDCRLGVGIRVTARVRAPFYVVIGPAYMVLESKIHVVLKSEP